MDAPFWRPGFRLALERMAARHGLRPLGELIGRHSLIVGDHVRPSRGESKGAGLPYEYYQTREFMPAGYNYAALERCDERAYRRLARTAVHQGDVLVSCAGVGGAGRGRVCLVTHQPGPSCTGDVFILRTKLLEPIYLFLFLGSRSGPSRRATRPSRRPMIWRWRRWRAVTRSTSRVSGPTRRRCWRHCEASWKANGNYI
jgi:hypothetical protein